MTTYTVIESLTKHGLMSSIQKEKKTLYIAEPPERLVAFVQKKMTHMEETLLSVKTAIQELKLLQKGDKPIVKMFEGEEALKAIQEDLVTSKPEKIDEFGNRDELLKLY
jgi:sugar-specific transcriptional regulator TrmB